VNNKYIEQQFDKSYSQCLRYGDTLLASKSGNLKCILFQRDFS